MLNADEATQNGVEYVFCLSFFLYTLIKTPGTTTFSPSSVWSIQTNFCFKTTCPMQLAVWSAYPTPTLSIPNYSLLQPSPGRSNDYFVLKLEIKGPA